jgi:hypothetical protein
LRRHCVVIPSSSRDSHHRAPANKTKRKSSLLLSPFREGRDRGCPSTSSG